MAKALFLGLSAAFFICYSLIASALLTPVPNPITNVGLPGAETSEVCEGFPPSSLDQFLICSGWKDIPIAGSFFTGVTNVLEFAGTLFGAFFQLLLFQVPEAVAASMITAIIFVPLGFVNAFIIFTAIRGSS